MNEATNQTKIKKKNTGLNWILWWQVDQDEIKKQVDEYHTLKIFKSARGVSTLLLLLSATVTVLLSVVMMNQIGSLLDVGAFLILAPFVYKGKKWALIAAMILWTLEKALSLFDGAASVTAILWWTIYMHQFYTAYKVEVAKTRPLTPTTN